LKGTIRIRIRIRIRSEDEQPLPERTLFPGTLLVIVLVAIPMYYAIHYPLILIRISIF
jgi:hypothetical protein